MKTWFTSLNGAVTLSVVALLSLLRQSFFVTYQGKFAGIALLLSILSIAIGLGIVAAQGRLYGLAAGFRGVEGIGQAASALSVMAWAGLPFALFQLIGFGILAVMLEGTGERTLATLSPALVLVALVVSTIEGTFQGSVTAWAGRQLCSSYAHTWLLPERHPSSQEAKGYTALRDTVPGP